MVRVKILCAKRTNKVYLLPVVTPVLKQHVVKHTTKLRSAKSTISIGPLA
uniref:Uncharacterized protein n=1 Tax=Arundo donax TaxID=35708 RepID=A0A0A9G102_ARUDO